MIIFGTIYALSTEHYFELKLRRCAQLSLKTTAITKCSDTTDKFYNFLRAGLELFDPRVDRYIVLFVKFILTLPRDFFKS